MTESVFAENMFGIKSRYELNVVSKSKDGKEIVIKTWNGCSKKMLFDEKKRCYIIKDWTF